MWFPIATRWGLVMSTLEQGGAAGVLGTRKAATCGKTGLQKISKVFSYLSQSVDPVLIHPLSLCSEQKFQTGVFSVFKIEGVSNNTSFKSNGSSFVLWYIPKTLGVGCLVTSFSGFIPRQSVLPFPSFYFKKGSGNWEVGVYFNLLVS